MIFAVARRLSLTLLLAMALLLLVSVQAEIDAETGKECVDNHENCPYWSEIGECDKNPSYMRINCKKSCDRCRYVRVSSEEDMQKFLQSKQGEIKAAQQANKARRVLQGKDEL